MYEASFSIITLTVAQQPGFALLAAFMVTIMAGQLVVSNGIYWLTTINLALVAAPDPGSFCAAAVEFLHAEGPGWHDDVRGVRKM